MAKTPLQSIEREKAKTRIKIKSATTKPKQKSIIQTSKSSVAFSIPATQYANRLNAENIFSDPFVFSCVKVLAESLASTPLELYESDGTKAKDFYLFTLLKRKANELQTPYEVLLWLVIDYYRYNYCIAFCPRDKQTNQVIGIYPLPANEVEIKQVATGEIFYLYGDYAFEEDEILKVINFFDRGITGTSLLDYQKNTLGTSAATETFAAESFSKGTFPAGICIINDGTTLEELKELKTRFKEEFSGGGNAGAVLMSAALKDYKPFSISNDEAQMIDARKFNRSLIAGLFRVPAHLINDLEKATFSNVEHLDLSFVKHTLRPIAKNFEQRLNLTLLTDEEAKKYDISFNFDALLRGDLLSRTQAVCQQVQAGLRDINEGRELLNLPPRVGGEILRANAALKPTDPHTYRQY